VSCGGSAVKGERWRECDFTGFSGYRVSDRGEVEGRTGRILKQTRTRDGYRYVRMHDGRARSACFYVHRLVVSAFDPDGPVTKDEDVHHRDEDKRNNRLENLYRTESWFHRAMHAKDLAEEIEELEEVPF